MLNDDFLEAKLEGRRNEGNFRSLKMPGGTVDFSSNDYLGLARNELLNHQGTPLSHGSTGSRLLTGNSEMAALLETEIARFHEGEAALIFNSGYDANIGLLGCVAQKGDTIIYDFLSHASIRDGIRLSQAQSFAFRHNDLVDLESRLSISTGIIFVVTESVFSMDGDIAPLKEIIALCEKFHAQLIVDEAHATGVTGPAGAGVCQALAISQLCFARIYTFGKALGCHGAVIVGSQRLKEYLVNFSRAFIYTTALPPAALAAIRSSYQVFPSMHNERLELTILAEYFQSADIKYKKLPSITPIQAVIIPGNEAVKMVSGRLLALGVDARPILYPTVPKGSERLRIVLHSFNTEDEIRLLINGLND